jgi:hypothetical protein
MTDSDRLRERIEQSKGLRAPSRPVTLCGAPDGTEVRADAPQPWVARPFWERIRLRRLRSGTLALVHPRPSASSYKTNRLDWQGLSVRALKRWRWGTGCLSDCTEGHTYGRWCQLGPKR